MKTTLTADPHPPKTTLPPGRFKVTADGKVKLVDFGLAKAFAGEESEASAANSPTLSMPLHDHQPVGTWRDGRCLACTGYQARARGIERLYHDALQLEEAAREDFLSRKCADDASRPNRATGLRPRDGWT
jgi:hypothetical protein